MSKRPIVRHFSINPLDSLSISESSEKDILNKSIDLKETDEKKEIKEEKRRKIPIVRNLPESYEETIKYNSMEQSKYEKDKKEDKKEDKKINKKCLARITNDTIFEYFGDRRHKFYFEFRCNYPCFENREVCIKCLQKKPLCTIQYSRLFDHGMIYEPIPDQSHIFGGKWYQENVIKWGEPTSDIIEFALEHQREARGKYEVIQPIYQIPISKAKQRSNSEEMPPRKKTITSIADEKQEEIQKPKRGRKPKVMSIQDLPPITEVALPESDPTKCIPNVTTRIKSPQENIKSQTKPRKRVARKKSEPSPYESLVQSQPLIYKDVSIPTHMEETLDEFNADGYEIEYIKLSTITIGLTSYFRDPIKNKLYRKIKDKTVGEYVGRYDPMSDTGIMSDIPDSDDESESED